MFAPFFVWVVVSQPEVLGVFWGAPQERLNQGLAKSFVRNRHDSSVSQEMSREGDGWLDEGALGREAVRVHRRRASGPQELVRGSLRTSSF